MIERASSFVLERQVGDPQLGEKNVRLAEWNSSLIKNVRNAEKRLRNLSTKNGGEKSGTYVVALLIRTTLGVNVASNRPSGRNVPIRRTIFFQGDILRTRCFDQMDEKSHKCDVRNKSITWSHIAGALRKIDSRV